MNKFYWPTYSTLSGYIVLVFIYKCSTNLELSKYIIHSQAYLATFAYTKVKNSGKVFHEPPTLNIHSQANFFDLRL